MKCKTVWVNKNSCVFVKNVKKNYQEWSNFKKVNFLFSTKDFGKKFGKELDKVFKDYTCNDLLPRRCGLELCHRFECSNWQTSLLRSKKGINFKSLIYVSFTLFAA